MEGFFAADGGIDLMLLLGGASLALALTGPGRWSAEAARTRDSTRHSPRCDHAHAGGKVMT
jgi:putative oxidoreductase